MKKNTLNQRGMGLGEMLMWAGLLALVAWAGWQLYQNPDALKPKSQTHGLYEDTQK